MNDQVGSDYACMPRSILGDGTLTIRPVERSHIEEIRRWRNAQMDVLRQSSEITPAQQERYYETHVWPQKSVLEPPNILLSYQDNGVAIGYGGLVHISWENRRAEVSFLLDPEIAQRQDDYARYFLAFLKLVRELALKDLQFERIFTETYATRVHHIGVLELAGFRREGVMKHHVMIDGEFVDSIIHGYLSSYDR